MSPHEDHPDPGALGAWRLPDELTDLADTVRRFMDSEVRPLEATLWGTWMYRPQPKPTDRRDRRAALRGCALARTDSK